MIKIWGRRNSFNVQKVMWLMGELVYPHEHISAGGSFGGLNTAEFLAMNPHGRIPVLMDDHIVVWESHAILRYLAASYGRPQFWSEDPNVRAKIEPWMDWMQTALQPDFLMGIFWNFYRTPEAQRDWSAIHKSIAACAKHFQLLDRIIKEQKFLCGNSLSLADICVGTTLYRYFTLEIDRPPLPNVERWYQELQNRPAYQQHVMIPYADLKGKLTL